MQAEAVGLPTGMVTFLFTDIEGSTRQLRRHGAEAYGVVADRHDAALRAAWRDHGGVEIGAEGDGFFVAFDDAANALAAAVTVQRELSQLMWPDGAAVRVRIGIHSGYAKPVRGDYRALAVNQASRLVNCAHGGQIFTTQRALDLVDGCVADISVSSLGRFQVRDFPAPVELFEVTAPGVDHVDVAPRVRPAEGHNIVRPTTTLVGRADELAAVADQLEPGTLQCLVGPAGVGKTRLAVEVAMHVADQWPDGVWFVDLAPVSAHTDLAAVVAETIGMPVSDGSAVVDDLVAHLRERRTLLVLDNCEHVLAAVAELVTSIRANSSDVAVLATSRRPLGLLDERVLRLATLSVDGPGAEAITLFRARAGGAVDAAALEDIGALCAELDGLPLAIELAAARARVASPADILRHLRESSEVIRSHDPTLPERQRSINRLLDWTEQLLPDIEQRVLHQLSVCASGFDLDLAAEVCSDLDPIDVAEAVWNLADVSLLALDPGAGETRYRLLVTVRAFARARVSEFDRLAAARRLGGALIERVGPQRPIDQTWLSELELELDNVRHAIDLLSTSDAVDDISVAQALAWSVARYGDEVASPRSAVEELDRRLDVLETPTPERVALLARSADLYLKLADIDMAEQRIAEAEQIVTVGVASWDVAGIVRTRSDIAVRRGDVAGAIEMTSQALTTVSDDRARSRLLTALSIAHTVNDDPESAVPVLEEAIRASRAADMDNDVANAQSNLAEALVGLGDLQAAAAHQLAALEQARAGGSQMLVTFSIILAAHLSGAGGEWGRAVRLYRAALRQLDEVAYVLYEFDVARGRQLEERAQGELGAAAFAIEAANGAELGFDAAADEATDLLRRVADGSADPMAAPAVRDGPSLSR